MLIRKSESWHIKESQTTPESTYYNRRILLKSLSVGSILALNPAWIRSIAAETNPTETDPSTHLYPVKKNEFYKADRPITDEKEATTYNNFFEFGSHKQIHKAAQSLPLRPWQIRIDGLVEAEQTLDIDTLLAKMPLEERIYRHRCVEAWSMTVPYSGFPLQALVTLARPLSSARYLRMETFMNPKVASGQRSSWYPWPYVEGLTMEEATHDLAFIATGLYGKPIPKQNGAPLRLAVPWKYGFKHLKSIVRFEFTDQRPKGYWEELQASEYGFWANVNPEVDHPRWSQATERVLGSSARVPTLPFNGYAEQIAGLYKDIVGEQLYR